MSFKKVLLLIGLLTVPVFIVYGMISSMWAISGFMAVIVDPLPPLFGSSEVLSILQV